MVQIHKGMTLVELMIAITIMGLAMAGFSLLLINSFKTNAFILEEGVTASTNSRAVDAIVSDLRRVRQGDNGGYPIVSGSDFDLKVYIDIDHDGVTERVHYFLEDGAVKRGVTDPTPGTPVTYASGDTTVTTLITSVVNTNTEPLFSYYNKDYPGDTAHNPLSTPIVTSDARLIRVWVKMNIDPVHAPDNINIESFAELRNLNGYTN